MHADHRSRETRVSEATHQKIFCERYGDRIAGEILLLASATDDDFLPAFYQELGGKSKGESERVLLQREVDQCGLSMAKVGGDVLPLSTIPPEGTSIAASRALSLNHTQAEPFDMSGEPTVGALSTADTQRLHNQKGYLPVSWMEARTQIRCTLALLGAVCGTDHPIPAGWRSMLHQYEQVEASLQNDIDTAVGTRLGPPLFVFHLQLILRDWFVEQTRTGQRFSVPAPDFGQYLNVGCLR
jgi:hypothetical protein